MDTLVRTFPSINEYSAKSSSDLIIARQTLDPTTRYSELDTGTYGHLTWENDPASNLTTLDDVIDMGYAADSSTIRDVMSTTSGLFCYFYL